MLKIIIPMLILFMSFAQAQDLKDAINLYDGANYNKALKILNNLPQNDTSVMHYSANCYYFKNDLTKACELWKDNEIQRSKDNFKLHCSKEKFMDFDTATNTFRYEDVIEVNDISADELYNRAKRWFINSYKSANAVIQLDNNEIYELIGKDFFEQVWVWNILLVNNVKVYHTIRVQYKDGRYKYEIYHFNIQYYVSGQYGGNVEATLEDFDNEKFSDKKVSLFEEANTNVELIIESLKKSMTTVDEDW